MFSAGDIDGAPGRQTLVIRDPALGLYRKLVLEGDRLAGAILYGDNSDASWYLDLMKHETDVSGFQNEVAFGPAFASAPA